MELIFWKTTKDCGTNTHLLLLKKCYCHDYRNFPTCNDRTKPSQLKLLQIVFGLYQFDGLILLEFDSEKANNSFKLVVNNIKAIKVGNTGFFWI